MKKGRLSTILLFAALFVGLAVLSYPTFSSWWNQRVQSHAIADYENTLADMTDEDLQKMFDGADTYNRELSELSFPFSEYESVKGYEELLDTTGGGIIGHISIPGINVDLPIYHGCSDAVLSVGVGHVQGSSLPVGGEGTHTALSAHRGLPTARLFTDLNKLQIGDIFTITVLDRVMTYQVDDIKTVKPHEMDSLKVFEGKDLATLVTCTPYGINSHRLLVRGTRVENAKASSLVHVAPEAYLIDPLTAAPFAAAPILFVLMMYVIFEPVKVGKRDIEV